MEWPVQEITDAFNRFLDTVAKVTESEVANGSRDGLIISCVIAHPMGGVTMCSNAPPHIANYILGWHLTHAMNVVTDMATPSPEN